MKTVSRVGLGNELQGGGMNASHDTLSDCFIVQLVGIDLYCRSGCLDIYIKTEI